MERQNNTLILAIVLGAGLVVVVLFAWLGGGSPLAKGEFDKGQRFTAKPGTTRENAMVLTSANRASTDDPKAAIARNTKDLEETGDPLEVKSLSEPKRPERGGAAGKVAGEALGSFSPEAGLRKLEAALNMPHSPDQSALLHEARGQLLTQLDPPNLDEAAKAFDKAQELSTDPLLDEDIRHEAVKALLQAGRSGEALQEVDEQLAAQPPAGESGFKLQLIQGRLMEETGDLAGAEKAYRAVLDAMATVPESLGADASLDLARMATLRLTQFYRNQNRGEDVEAVASALRKQIAQNAKAAEG